MAVAYVVGFGALLIIAGWHPHPLHKAIKAISSPAEVSSDYQTLPCAHASRLVDQLSGLGAQGEPNPTRQHLNDLTGLKMSAIDAVDDSSTGT